MTELQARFGELRSAVHSLEGDARWTKLTELLNDWPEDHFHELVLPYLEGILRHDTSLREAPQRWHTIDAHRLIVHHAFALARAVRWTDMLSLEDLGVLVGSPDIDHITHLHLTHYNFGDEGAVAIARAPHLKNLTHLHLDHNGLSDEGVKALASSPHLENLTHLHLYWNAITAEGAVALASSPHLHKLTLLDLGQNEIGDEGSYGER